MKKLLFELAIVISLVTTITSCTSILGKNIQMDSPEAIQAIKDAIKNNIDLTTFKITEISWSGKGSREKLDNKLGYLNVDLVDKNNKAYLQQFTLNKEGKFAGEDMKEKSREIYYEFVKGIDVDKLDAAIISKQLDEAKPLIGEEYEIKALESYSISEKTLDMSTKSINEKNPFFKGHNPDEYGSMSTRFTLDLLKKGEDKEINGRNITTNYYEVDFKVDENGKLEINE